MSPAEWENIYKKLEHLQLSFKEIYTNKELSFLNKQKLLIKIMEETVSVINSNLEIRNLLFLNRSQRYIDYMENKGYFIKISYIRYTSNLLRKINTKFISKI